jgi:hypothetical protein
VRLPPGVGTTTCPASTGTCSAYHWATSIGSTRVNMTIIAGKPFAQGNNPKVTTALFRGQDVRSPTRSTKR